VFALLVLAAAVNPSSGLDQISPTRGAHAWDLEWHDAEDRLTGFIRPLDPVEGQDVEVSLRVGPFQGEELDGPLTVSMRCEGWSQTQNVGRAKDSKAWFVVFKPQDSGECHIDVGWQTTRRKLVHTSVLVTPAPIARTPWYVLIAVIAAVALALGVRAALRKT
jgi:hypothetical protein